MTDVALTGPNPIILNPADQIEALASALAKHGFTTKVHTVQRFVRHPCCVVSCGPSRHVVSTELVFAAPDEKDDWFFWRVNPQDPLAAEEKVAALTQPSAAADLLARTIPQVG